MKSSEKEEMEKAGFLKGLAKHGLIGLTGAAGLDALAYNGNYDNWDTTRIVNGLMNTGLIGGGSWMVGKGVQGMKAGGASAMGGTALAGTGIGLMATAPNKDAANRITGTLPEIGKGLTSLAKAQADMANNTKGIVEATEKNEGSGALPWVLGLLGIGGLGLGGYGLYKWLNKEDKSQSKMRIKLPGVKGDPDSGAEVELPINPAKISPGLMSRINSTVLRRTRSNVRYAAKKVDPETGKKIPYEEWVMKYGDEEDREALRQELTETGDQQENIDAMVEDLNTPLPPGDPRLKEASYIPAGFITALRKAAGFEEAEEIVDNPELQKKVMEEEEKGKTRAKHESRGFIWGNAPGYIGGALLGGMIGDSAIGGDTGGLIGAGAGTLLGGLLPWEIGLFAGAHAEPRTREEQEEHDKGTPWPEYVIPGYAAYQMMRRQRSKKKKSEQEKKASATREGHEFLGSTLSSFPASILGALGGAYLAEGHGVNPVVGRVIGGGLGAFLPALIGGGLAYVGKERTPEEQAEHDAERPWMEYLIPGYATYQLNKRNQAEEIEKERFREQMQAILANHSFKSTGQKLPPSFKGGESTPMAIPLDELVDIKKEAGMLGAPPPMMGPPPPPMPPAGGMMGPPPMMGGGMMPPGPMGLPPVSPQQTRQVDPNQNQPAQGIPRPAKTQNIRDKARRAGQQVQIAASKGVFQALPSQRASGGAQGISQLMQGVKERIHNIRASRYAR